MAIARMAGALSETVIDGLTTNLPLHQRLVADAGFRAGGFDIHHLEGLIREGRLKGTLHDA